MTTAILLVALAAQAFGLPNVSGAAVPIVPAAPHASDAGRAHSVSASRPSHDAPKHPRHQLSGKASWFATGRNGHYAAACAPLRRAMGRHWRGKQVLVAYGRRAIIVILNDWCGSRDKTIDLSDESFDYLSHLSAGVIRVKVGW